MTGPGSADEVIRRVPQYCRPEAIAGLDAQVLWELPAGRTTHRYGIVFDHGIVRAGPDVEVIPQVTLRCSDEDALLALTGEAEPTLMVLDGRLELSGDERLAVEMLGFFRVPAADGNAEPVAASLRTDPALFLKIVTGSANPVTSFLRRKISVHGDVGLAMRLPQLFDIPHG